MGTAFSTTRARNHVKGSREATPRVRDEDYVLGLCDALFGESGARQHTFDWLTGDPDARGNRARLRVDGYFARANVVVEYRERQHFEPVPHFDKPHKLTISGVHRGQQRRRYDELRDTLIPQHGITLWVITPDELNADARGRLTARDERRDQRLLRAAWERLQLPPRSS